MDAFSMEAAARSGTEPRSRFPVGPFELLRRFGARLGPYVLLELLLPGGTLFALLFFLYQRRKPRAGSPPTLNRLASPPAVVSTLGRGIPVTQADGKGDERSWDAAPGMVRGAGARASPDFGRARLRARTKAGCQAGRCRDETRSARSCLSSRA